MGVGIGLGNSLMGLRHLPKLKPGTSKVMVGALQADPLALDSDLESELSLFLELRGSKTSTMICVEVLVGDMLGLEVAELTNSPELIFLTSLCWPNKVLA